jgi:hypothetical protein
MARKDTFRQAFRDWAEISNIDLDASDDVQRSHWLTTFYVQQIIRRLQPGMVPDDDEDLEACIVDGARDNGVDLVCKTDDKVLILQAKYRSTSRIEDKNEVDRFFDVFRRIHPRLGKQYKKSDKLAEALSDIDWAEDQFELRFITLGRCSDEIRTREKSGPSAYPDTPEFKDLAERCELVFLDESDLNEEWRESESTDKGLERAVELQPHSHNGSAPWVEYENAKGIRSYIFVMAASKLAQLYQFRGTRARLFSLNIRNYIGDNKTNKRIRETASSDPEHFFFYNNGVSAIASKINADLTTGKLSCEQFSIINGAQTIRSLTKANNLASGKVANAYVLFRISEVSLGGKADEQAFLTNITRFNNTQNAIKLSDFLSNDPIQTALARKFETISFQGKKYWYKNKRSGEQRKSTIPIGLEEFGKSIHAFSFGPVDVFGGNSYLFDQARGKGYAKVFGDGQDAFVTLDTDTFLQLSGIWFICDVVYDQWKLVKEHQAAHEADFAKHRASGGGTELITKSALERRWLVYFVVGELMRQVCAQRGINIQTEIARFAKPQFALADGVEHVREYVETACEILVKQYRSASKRADFTHRNWFRDSRTLRELEQDIADSPRLLKQLPNPSSKH